jgi:D-alanyl-D-alanine carboxypeptidase
LQETAVNAAVCSAISGWFPSPHGILEIRQVYGDISVSGDQVVGPTWWESVNMVHVDNLPMWGPRRLYVHKKIVPMLHEALAECERLGGYELRTLGCFAPRMKRSSPTLSVHSWGAAVDINADDNPPMRIRTPDDLLMRRKTIPDEWVAAFKSIGWAWGGDFSSYWDPMHFQWCSAY